MSIQQTIFTVLAIIISLVIADLTGFTSGKNKLKKLLPFKKAKQIDSEEIQKKITDYAISDPFYNTHDEMVHFFRLNVYGKSKYLGEMFYKEYKCSQEDFLKEQEKIIEKFNIKPKKRNLDKQKYEDIINMKKYLNQADRYYEDNRIIEAFIYYEKVLRKSSTEVKKILGKDAMIRINNRIWEYRRRIKP